MPPAPKRKLQILMTTDAVSSVWSYSLSLSRSFSKHGVAVTLAGSGPRPSAEQEREAAAIAGLELVWLDLPLDRAAADAVALAPAAGHVAQLAREKAADIVHLNAPAEAVGLRLDRPVIVAAHFCPATWWKAVRKGPAPEDWRWRIELNRVGLAAADLVLAPSQSFAAALDKVYGPLPHLKVVPTGGPQAKAGCGERQDRIVAVGRWWDEGENLIALEAAAASVSWPVEAIGPLEGPDGTRAPETASLACPGPLAEEEAAARAAGARIFVSTALYDPSGLRVLTGARAGNALVLSDIPAFREMWEGAALFVDARDPEMIARTLNRLVRHATLRDILADAARVRAERYAPEAQALGVLRAYAEAAAGSRAAVARAS